MSINVLSALICDEVRQEADGRAIILGAAPVGPEVNVTGETVLSRVGFYVEAAISGAEVVHFRLIRAETDHVPLEVQMYLTRGAETENETSDQDASAVGTVGTIVFGKRNVTIKGPGNYTLQYMEDQEPWKEIRTFFFPPKPLDDDMA